MDEETRTEILPGTRPTEELESQPVEVTEKELEETTVQIIEETKIQTSEKTEIISNKDLQLDDIVSIDKLEDFFAIKSKVGDGGMGVVYLAKDIRLNRYVAIKRLKSQFLVDAQIRKRFLQEAKAVASLNHANIVHIYFIGEDNDGPYFVMEYVEGAVADPENQDKPNPPQTLEQYIATNGVMNIDEAIEFMGKIGGAVAAAHASGVIHRDLKPSNILIDISNFPKIVDFGLARLTNVELGASSLTVEGDKFISLGYGAPEQEQDASTTDERADIYGLGGIAYYILTGKNPRFFREDDLPEYMRASITKALATDREQRWESAEAFIASLMQCKTESLTEYLTVKTTWRCKWCDTINSLTTNYCGNCGWDGGTFCPECGSPNHFGIMFCSTCGANCKEYERAKAAYDEASLALESAQFEKILKSNPVPLNFEPIGPNGRKIVDQINQIYVEAKKKQDRCEELEEIIVMEINAENYERAERFIKEYRSLTLCEDAYEAELLDFNNLKQRRDLARVARAFSISDWDFGHTLLQTMKNPSNSANALEYDRLGKIFKRHKMKKNVLKTFLYLSVVLIYIALLPVASAYLPNNVARIGWYPAYWVVNAVHLTQPTESLLQSLGGGKLTTIFETNIEFKNEFLKGFEENQEKYQTLFNDKKEELHKEYLESLSKLAAEFKKETNMDAYNAVENEKMRFLKSKEVKLLDGDSDAAHKIISIQKAYIQKRDRALVVIYQKYVTETDRELSELEKIYKEKMLESSKLDEENRIEESTKIMNEALMYHKVKKTVEQFSFYKEAKKSIKLFDKKYPEMAAAIYQADSDVKIDFKIIEEKKLEFENTVVQYSANRKAKEQSRYDDYKKALDQLLVERRNAGDLDGVNAIEIEQNRFAQSQFFVENIQSDALSNLINTFIVRQQNENRVIDEELIAFVNKYDKELKECQERETKADNLPLARAIQEERTRVQDMIEIKEIRLRLENNKVVQ